MAAALAVASLCGAYVVWQRRLERLATDTFASLDRRADRTQLQRAIDELDGHARFAADVRLLRAILLFDAGRQREAVAMIDGVRPEGRLRLMRLVMTGKIMCASGRLSDAVRFFKRVEAEYPDAVSPHRWLATICHELGAMHAAYEELKIVARLQPDDFFAYRLMGLVEKEDFGRDKDAAENYRKALDRHPPPDQAQMIRRELAHCLVNLNDYQGALEVLDGATADARVLALKAECRWNLGDMEAARTLLAQATDRDASDRTALLLTARLAMDEGKPRSALAPLKKLLEIDPHDYDARYQLSQVYQRTGDKQAAAAEVEQMNKSKALREKLARLYDRAMVRPQDPEIRDEIAELCDTLGQHRLADGWRRAAEGLRESEGLTGRPR